MTGHKRKKEMSNELNPKTDPSQPVVYQIRIKGAVGTMPVVPIRPFGATRPPIHGSSSTTPHQSVKNLLMISGDHLDVTRQQTVEFGIASIH